MCNIFWRAPALLKWPLVSYMYNYQYNVSLWTRWATWPVGLFCFFYRTRDPPRRYRWWIQDRLLRSGGVLAVLRQNQSGHRPASNMAAWRRGGTVQTCRPEQLHRWLYVYLCIHLINWIMSISNVERISHLEKSLDLKKKKPTCLQV